MSHVDKDSHDHSVLYDLDAGLDSSAQDALIRERKDNVLDDPKQDDKAVDYDWPSFLLDQSIRLQAW